MIKKDLLDESLAIITKHVKKYIADKIPGTPLIEDERTASLLRRWLMQLQIDLQSIDESSDDLF